MTIYVDQYPGTDWGKWTGGGHLLGTDLAELHKFARLLGLKRAWFQDRTFPHYDLVRSKRKLALQNGAVAIEPGELPNDILIKQGNTYVTYAESRLGKQ